MHQIVVCINFSQNLCLRIVAPKKLRTDIMSLAHDPPTGWATWKQENKRTDHAKFLLAGYVHSCISLQAMLYLSKRNTEKKNVKSEFWTLVLHFPVLPMKEISGIY